MDELFKDSIKLISNIPGIILKQNNIIDENIPQKKYFSIQEIEEEIKNIMEVDLFIRKKNLETLIKQNQKILDSDEYSKEKFLFIIKLLINDNTNKEILKIYLQFLKKYEKKLIENFGKEKIEEFKDEIIYFKCCFKKEEYQEFFKLEKKSEIQQIIEILELLKEKQYDKIPQLHSFSTFNQPISFTNIELYMYQIRINLLSQISEFLKNKKENSKKLGSLSNISKLIINDKSLENPFIINNQLIQLKNHKNYKHHL